MTEELPEVRRAGTTNTSLHAAKRSKNDEFYTQLTDIEKEMCEYKDHFKGKVVFCNCDDPEWSNFYKYFTLNFEHLKLAKVVTTHYANNVPAYKLEYFGASTPPVRTDLAGDGDFRSEECVAILKEADIVVTNPPFSLFREYVAQLAEHGKSFIIIGNKNAITYKSIFESIKENKIWAVSQYQLGYVVHPSGRFRKMGKSHRRQESSAHHGVLVHQLAAQEAK